MVRVKDVDSSSRAARTVPLSFCGFAFWWLIILGVHLVTCIYDAAYAKFYWDFDSISLSYTLESYEIGMPRKSFRTIAYVHVPLAAVHGVSAFFMVAGSLWRRRLVFYPGSDITREGPSNTSSKLLDREDSGGTVAKRTSCIARVGDKLTTAWKHLTHRDGLLGVDSRHFHTILICRELLETALQTAQAIRMSKFLPRARLNRFYVILLVVNCWSSVFIYSRWFWRDEARRRFASVVCDCALDLMSVVGVAILIMLSYVEHYNVEVTDFDFDLLDDSDWMVQMLNEAQMVIVVSWSDLATRVVFSTGLIATMAAMKDLLYNASRKLIRVAPSSRPDIAVQYDGPSSNLTGRAKENVPDSAASTKFHAVVPNVPNIKTNLRTQMKRTLLHGVHFAFAVWGVVVLALHVHASLQSPLIECIPKVRPMAGALPSCFWVNFNCTGLGISAKYEEVQSEWDKFDRRTALKLEILHCSALEVPESFQDFVRLQEIRIYNSTIVNWGLEAAVTNANHPDLSALSIVRVNMTNGVLPLGFQALDFPLYLYQIFFCETNLHALPDDLDLKWHTGSNIYVENSNLTIVPPVLMRLQPYALILAGNPITEFPPELFEVEYMQVLSLSRTKVHELPQNVLHLSTSFTMIELTSTDISFFWSWIDPLVENTLDITPPILGGGSIYCSERDKIMNGESTHFSVSFQPGHSPLLMNVSESNWDLLRLAVDCSPLPWATLFPLEYWDELYGFVTV